MMKPSILKAILVSALFSVTCFIHGQAKPLGNPDVSSSGAKPFKVLTNGRQITVQAKEQMRSIMAWTSSGHRIVEQKEININTLSFNVPSKEKIVFILVELVTGKRYTEKLGLK